MAGIMMTVSLIFSMTRESAPPDKPKEIETNPALRP